MAASKKMPVVRLAHEGWRPFSPAAVERQSLWHEENRVNVTITIGVAPYQDGYTTSEWINVADEKRYEGKKSGKNQVAT